MPYAYTRSDAARESYEEAVDDVLDGIVGPLLREVQEMDETAVYPHPLDYMARLLSIWIEDGDDGLCEYLEEEYREEAEEVVRDNYSGPCCYQFSCPCGNTNGYRG